jgi:excisionase family DNA binding protein
MGEDGRVGDWLSLSEASTLLGVHPSTLRRWADSGRVPCQRTPGGHRRFSRQRLSPMIEGSAVSTPSTAEVKRVEDEPWHEQFAAADLVGELRELGQRLSGVLVQYLLRSDDDERYLAEGRRIAVEYARQSRGAAIGLLDAVRAFQFYRANFIDLLPQLPSSDPSGNLRLYGRYDEFMSEMLLALLGGYYEDRRNGRA